MMAIETISPAEAAAIFSEGNGLLLDVRTAAEFREVHANGAVLMPLDILNRQSVEALRASAEAPLFMMCASGIRARKAAEILIREGLTHLFVVEGGTKGWVASGLPVVRGKKTISIERQVRIGAGTLVFAGVLLGWFVNRGFFLLAAFVGAGLVFAGVTDICGMAMVLAKAPWNRT